MWTPKAVGFSCVSTVGFIWGIQDRMNGQSFSKVTRKSETKQQGPRSHCFLLPCGANTVKRILWVNPKDSGDSSQIWGQFSSANLTLGKLLVLVFLRLTWDILHRIVKIIWNNTWKAVVSRTKWACSKWQLLKFFLTKSTRAVLLFFYGSCA